MYALCIAFPLTYVSAKVVPAEAASINYRIAGFTIPQLPIAKEYFLEIAVGNHISVDSFIKNIVLRCRSGKKKIIAEVPYFGCQYTWRITCKVKGNVCNSALYHFNIAAMPQSDTDSVRLRVITSYPGHDSDYVFIDGNKALYDLQGHPVWYLPDTGELATEINSPRDIKATSYGTITFMVNEQPYEINYNGEIIWKQKGKTDLLDIEGRKERFFHHDFLRLDKGNYLGLGVKNELWELPEPIDSSIQASSNPKIVRTGNKTYQHILMKRLIEFDQPGNIVWSWNSSDYFKQSDLFYRRAPNGLFILDNTHENAFFVDEQKGTIYLSFRDLNRIIKLQYPSGKVLNTYGVPYRPDGSFDNGLFCGQHACRLSMDGYIYLYNNNTCNYRSHMPTIVMMKEPGSKNGQLEKVWEYECVIDSMSDEQQKKIFFETGGSVQELSDRSVFCCMGTAYSKVFIVTRGKKEIWSAVPETFNSKSKTWKISASYRASIITRKQLESLIWHTALKN